MDSAWRALLPAGCPATEQRSQKQPLLRALGPARRPGVMFKVIGLVISRQRGLHQLAETRGG